MVHIADGILAPEVWVTGFIITGLILIYVLKRTPAEEIPKISLVTSAVFIASLIHIPIGPTSVHLILAGPAGILLGRASFPAIFIALLLQAFLFQHGGITTLGINTLNIGVPALISSGIFIAGVNHTKIKNKIMLFGALAGGLAIVLAVILTSIMLLISGDEFWGIVIILIIAYLPVIVIEAMLVGGIAKFLAKVKPEMLIGGVKK